MYHNHLHHHPRFPQLFTVAQNETKTTPIVFNETFNFSTASLDKLQVSMKLEKLLK